MMSWLVQNELTILSGPSGKGCPCHFLSEGSVDASLGASSEEHCRTQGGRSEQDPAAGRPLYKTIPKANSRTPSLGFRINIRSQRCATLRLRPLDILTPPENGAPGRIASSTARNEPQHPKTARKGLRSPRYAIWRQA